MSIFKWFTSCFKSSKQPSPLEVIVADSIEKSVQAVKSEQPSPLKITLNELANSYHEYKNGEFETITPPLPEVTAEKQLKYDNYAKWYRVKASNYYKHLNINNVSLEEKSYVTNMESEIFIDGETAYIIVDGVRYDLNSSTLYHRTHSREYLNPFAKFKAITNTCNSNIRNLPYGEPIWFTKKGKETVDKFTKLKGNNTPQIIKPVKPKKKTVKKVLKKK